MIHDDRPTSKRPGGGDGGAEDGRRALAARIWRDAVAADEHGNHRRVRAYLTARGLDLDRWPGGVVPPSIRFNKKCLDIFVGGGWETAPAMVARCVTPLDPPHLVTLVHRTFLDPGGEPLKRAIDEGADDGRAARMHKGVPNGHAIWLYDHTVDPVLAEAGPFPGGVLIAGEGLETSAACMQATRRCAVSALDINGLRKLELDPAIFEPFDAEGNAKPDGWWVHTLILAADLDRSGTGQVQTPKARERLALRHPRATVVVRFPTPAVAPTLVEAAASAERVDCPRCQGKRLLRPSDPRSTCPKCDGEGSVGFWSGQHRPVRGADGVVGKTVDWLDVLVKHGDEAVATGLMGGLDLERNRARALAWKPEAATVSNPDGSDTPMRGASLPSPAEANASPGVRTRDGRGNIGGTGRGGGAGGGGGWAFGDGGAEAPTNLKGLVKYIDGFEEPVLSQSPLHRAWAYLLMECPPPQGSRRFTLAYWGGSFYHFDGWGGAWVRLPETAIEGAVQRWLQRFRYEKPDGDVPMVNPTNRAVHEVLKSLAAEVLVDVSKVPTWLPDSMDAHGVPVWGEACRVWETRRRREELERRFGAAEEWIVFPNGRLSLKALLDRRVVLEPNTPTLFTPAARPYPLPARELEQAVTSGFTDDLFTRLCPWWRRGLHDWCGGDADGGVQRVRQLQLMFGDSISPNRTLEKIFVVSGPRRSGKGCIQEALKAACGEDAVATPSFFDLGDRFGLVSFLGKSLAIFSDAHMGHMTDGARVTEVLKVISGGDAVTVRDLHTAPQTNVKIGCRFWIFVNDMMRLTDSSGALAGRFVIWPMLRSFFDTEEGDVKRGIMGEGAGIAVWALCGYVELFGMKRPAIEMGGMARTIADEFAGSSSVIISFLRECCVCNEGGMEVKYDPAYWEPFGDVYNVYRRHCERQGNQPVANNRFVAQLRPHVPLVDTDQIGTGTRYRKLVGIKLRDDLDSELTQPSGQRLVSYARPGDVVHGAAAGAVGGDPALPFEQRYPT